MSDDVYERLRDAVEIRDEVVSVADLVDLRRPCIDPFRELVRSRRMPVERPRGVGRTWRPRNMELGQ